MIDCVFYSTDGAISQTATLLSAAEASEMAAAIGAAGWITGNVDPSRWRVDLTGDPTLVELPPVVVPDPTLEEILAAERARMRVFRRAFRAELQARPVSEIPALAAVMPTAPHLLAAADAYAASLDIYHPLRSVWTDVIQFLRLHPDMALFTAAPPDGFGVAEEWLDDVFRAAAAREA